jgi:hypothetical protein
VQPVLPERVCGSDATRRDSRQVRSSPQKGELHPPNPRQVDTDLEIKTQTGAASSERSEDDHVGIERLGANAERGYERSCSSPSASLRSAPARSARRCLAWPNRSETYRDQMECHLDRSELAWITNLTRIGKPRHE